MSDELKNLAVNELKIPGITADTDLSFIARYDLKKLWSFLAENVKSKESSQTVHQNLAILAHHQSCKYVIILLMVD